MHIGRNLTSGALGGLVRGAELGLLEAVFHLATSGAPDLWSPVYGVVLYSAIGLPFGMAAGVGISVIERMVQNTKWKIEEFLPFVAGEVLATIPMLGFILYYLGNKLVYAEQGVPLTGKMGILAILGVAALANLVVGRKILKGKGKILLKPAGTLLLLIVTTVFTLVLALLPLSANPRNNFGAERPVPAALEDAPNVLFIMVDTLRADHLRAGLTPNIDAMAADGVVFEQAFAQASWTRSSGASLWTSRLPSSHNADTKASRLSEDAVLWSETLQDAGVTTGALVNNINLTESFGFNQGFDTFLYESPDYSFGGTESVFALTFYKVVHKVAEKLFGGTKEVSSYYQPAPVVLADAQAFIEANADGRWALYVHLMEPHDPYFEHPILTDPEGAEFNGTGFARAEVEEPDPSDADYLRAVYADEVRWLDREVAPFLEWLKAEGLYDDTVIVLTADHGEEFYEHGGWWHGTTLYDEQLHVPLVVKPAGNALAGTVVPWQVRNIDVAPTLAAAMGIAPDDSWAGEDLMPPVVDWVAELAKVDDPPVEPAVPQQDGIVPVDADVSMDGEAPVDAPVDGEEPADEEPVIDPTLDPCYVWPQSRVVVAEEDFEGNVLGAIRTQGFKLIRANDGNPRGLANEEVFHVATDPGETANLVGSSGQICGRYMDSAPDDLGAELGEIIVDAVTSGVDGGSATMTLAECQALVALGYLDNCDGL